MSNNERALPNVWSAGGVAALFESLSPAQPLAELPSNNKLLAFRKAASVLAHFDPTNIRSIDSGDTPSDEVLEQLRLDCGSTHVSEGRLRWYLKPSIRRETLQSFRTRDELRQALFQNERPKDEPLQAAIDLFILGERPDLDRLNEEQLLASAQAIPWLEGIPAKEPLVLPRIEEVQQRTKFLQLVNPLRRMVGTHFRGRSDELNRLKNYVFSNNPEPAFVVWGIGGMGKSSLLAKFFLDNIELQHESRFPCAYLDFDRPTLSPEEPATLLLEVLAQIPLQFPEVAKNCELLTLVISEQLAKESSGQVADQRVRGSLLHSADGHKHLQNFAAIVNSLTKEKHKPFVLILDTFEEVQYRSREFTTFLWDFFSEMRSHLPTSRVIVGGRTKVFERLECQLELQGLDREAALACLEALNLQPNVAEYIFDRVGSNPLNLRLAAELVRKEMADPNGLRDFLSEEFSRRLQDERIQGYLFRRILDHIHNEDVRRLAHPGLVLRRITPEIILEVLAKPCKVKVPNLEAAQKLFDELSRETALVEVGTDLGELRYRPDLRREMLRLLVQSDLQPVASLHRRAIKYYSQRDDVLSRAEELYHRMMLDQTPLTLDKRWCNNAEYYLRGAIEELPLRAQAYLASKSSIGLETVLPSPEAAEAIWRSAGLVEWERQTARRVRDLIRLRRFDKALEVIRERDERSKDSPLFTLEARVLKWLGLWAEARQVLEQGIKRTARGYNLKNQLGIYLYLFRVCFHLGDVDAARKAFVSADELSKNEHFKEDFSPDRLALALANIKLAESQDEKIAVMEQASKLLANTSWFDLRKSGQMITRLAAELIDYDLNLVIRLIRVCGLPMPSKQAIEELGEALYEWQNSILRSQPQSDLAARLTDGPPLNASRRDWISWVALKTNAREEEWIIRLLQASDPPPDVREALAVYLRGVEELSKLVESEEVTGLLSSIKVTLLKAILESFDETELERFAFDELDVRWFDISSEDETFQQKTLSFINHAFTEDVEVIEKLRRALIKRQPNSPTVQELSKLFHDLEILD